MAGSASDEDNLLDWCRACGTSHVYAAPCPGVVKLTEPSKKVWQTRYTTSGGETVFFITLTPWSNRWCARIFTHPNIPWAIPGGGTAVKFLGDSPEESKEAAVRFLTGFCRRKGYERPGIRPSPPEPSEADRPVRVPQSIPLVWGIREPSNPGASLNVSSTGMFVATELPPEPGTMVRIRLTLGALSLPLRGRVTWKRPLPDPGRRLAAGMGIHLLSPPSIYKGYIQQFI